MRGGDLASPTGPKCPARFAIRPRRFPGRHRRGFDRREADSQIFVPSFSPHPSSHPILQAETRNLAGLTSRKFSGVVTRFHAAFPEPLDVADRGEQVRTVVAASRRASVWREAHTATPVFPSHRKLPPLHLTARPLLHSIMAPARNSSETRENLGGVMG